MLDRAGQGRVVVWAKLATEARNAWRVWARYPPGLVSVGFLLGIVLIALVGPVVYPRDPGEINLQMRFHSPSLAYPMGTDHLGQDLLSRAISATRISIYIGCVAAVGSVIIGGTIGIASSYFGGRLDLIVQRATDILLSLPTLVFALVLAATLGPSIHNVALAIGTVIVPQAIRTGRASGLSVKEEPYVDSALAIGCGRARIIFKHIAPQCVAPLLVMATVTVGWAIVLEASLSFLGLGVPIEKPSWGGMLTIGMRDFALRAPWMAVIPGVIITVVILALNVMGDTLRDVLDPRLRGT